MGSLHSRLHAKTKKEKWNEEKREEKKSLGADSGINRNHKLIRIEWLTWRRIMNDAEKSEHTKIVDLLCTVLKWYAHTKEQKMNVVSHNLQHSNFQANWFICEDKGIMWISNKYYALFLCRLPFNMYRCVFLPLIFIYCILKLSWKFIALRQKKCKRHLNLLLTHCNQCVSYRIFNGRQRLIFEMFGIIFEYYHIIQELSLECIFLIPNLERE